MEAKSIIKRLLEDLMIQLDQLSEDDLMRVGEGTHELSLKLKKKKAAISKSNELPFEKLENLLKELQECKSREQGHALLARKLKTKDDLESFARHLDVLILKRDNINQIISKIIEATVGAMLRSKAIQGNRYK